MKIFILGLDGCEYNFVKPREYPVLKQEECGKTILPKATLSWYPEMSIYNPFTPTIWTSFLTGKIPEEHGITRDKAEKVWNNKLLNVARKHYFLRWLVHHAPQWKKLFPLLGFKKLPMKITVPTIFDYADNTIHVQVPVVDTKWEHQAPLGMHKKSVPEIIEYLEARFIRTKKFTLRLLDSGKPWDLFMAYVSILDWAGHGYWGLDQKMEEYYNIAEQYAYEIKKRLDPETWVLIVSDHGIMRLPETKVHGGMHSYHAYWSSNIKLGRKEIGLLEWFPLIKEYLKGEPPGTVSTRSRREEHRRLSRKPVTTSKEDEKIIKERLKALGYI